MGVVKSGSLGGLVVVGIIALRTIGNGGDWFDFLQSDARYENARIHFEFNILLFCMSFVLLGLAGWALFESVHPFTSQHL